MSKTNMGTAHILSRLKTLRLKCADSFCARIKFLVDLSAFGVRYPTHRFGFVGGNSLKRLASANINKLAGSSVMVTPPLYVVGGLCNTDSAGVRRRSDGVGVCLRGVGARLRRGARAGVGVLKRGVGARLRRGVGFSIV